MFSVSVAYFQNSELGHTDLIHHILMLDTHLSVTQELPSYFVLFAHINAILKLMYCDSCAPHFSVMSSDF